MSLKPIPLVFALLLVVPYLCLGQDDCEPKALIWLQKSCVCDKIAPADAATYMACLTKAHGVDTSATGQQKKDNMKLVAKNRCAKGDIFNAYNKCMKDGGIDSMVFEKNVNDNC